MPLPVSPTPIEGSALQANRASAQLRLEARNDAGISRLVDLVETGGYRLKFPTPQQGLEAVIINTGGGLLGGDSLSIGVVARADTELMVTTQSSEKIYRAVAGPSIIDIRLEAEAGARLHWLPQDAILFSGARLTRRIEADVADSAELVIAESAVFGRLAMGEVLRSGLLADRWRIRRAGRLDYADDLRLEGNVSFLLDRPALGGGARAAGTLLVMAGDAEQRLDAARELIEYDGVSAGASAWEGKLVVRLLAVDPEPLRFVMARLAAGMTDRETPRIW